METLRFPKPAPRAAPERDAPKPQRHFPGHQPQMTNTQQQGVWASDPHRVTWGRE